MRKKTETVKPADRIDDDARACKRAGKDPRTGPSHCVKRDCILSAAARVFQRDGYQGAGIDLIACEAGVSRQTIYNHYRDKDALLAAVVDDALERMNASLYAALDAFPQPGDDLEKGLVAFSIRLSRTCVYDSSGAFLRKLMQSPEAGPPDAASLCGAQGPARSASAIAVRLRRLAAAGDLRIADPDIAARHFMALITAEAHFHMLAGGAVDDAVIARSARHGVRTFLSAFAPCPGPARWP